LGEVGLLAGEAAVIREAIVAVEHLGRGEGVTIESDGATRTAHRLALLEGSDAAEVDPILGGSRSINLGSLWVWCREAIDAEHADVAVRAVSSLPVVTPYALAVRAAIRAAAGHDELLWHQALDIAAAHDLALIT
ncbi:hypothetical protein, partial [Klebsiella pneumoniae]|uniref:hypothetical protein n=1 Tax=Klebsiella pneumoniae TaxID=573 RepID=UPI0031330CCF